MSETDTDIEETPATPRRTRGPTRPEIRFADLLTATAELDERRVGELVAALDGSLTGAEIREAVDAQRAALKDHVRIREAELAERTALADHVAAASKLPPHLRTALIHTLRARIPAPEPTFVRFSDQWSLGKLIDALAGLPPDMPVEFDHGPNVGSAASYRGYYEDLALSDDDPAIPQRTVRTLLAALLGCVGAKFEGYKGGSYGMTRDTPLWVAAYGDATGRFVRGVEVLEGRAVILTAVEKD